MERPLRSMESFCTLLHILIGRKIASTPGGQKGFSHCRLDFWGEKRIVKKSNSQNISPLAIDLM